MCSNNNNNNNNNNKKIEGIRGIYRRSTDANCQDTPTQHKLNTVPYSHQSPEISSE
jgi:hypothetical protein